MNSSNSTSPLLKILAKGLNLWIRSKCNLVDSLSIDIQGSSLNLMRGSIDKLSIKAEGIDYQGIIFDTADIKSSKLKISLSFDNKTNLVKLDDTFEIDGKFSMSNNNINQVLMSERWHFISTLIARKLMDSDHLLSVSIESNLLKLKAFDPKQDLTMEDLFSVSVSSDTIKISNTKTNNYLLLPMDKLIKIKCAFIERNIFFIKGKALVMP